MRKVELTPTQLRDLNVFNLIFDLHHWEDGEETEMRMDHGEAVNPEGLRVTNCRNILLEARFHAPVNMISLRLTDLFLEDCVQFHFLYDNQPERIVEWLIQHAEELSLESYPDLLKEADAHCEMILLEVSDTEIYEVKPSANL
jgi:hypothetical protein